MVKNFMVNLVERLGIFTIFTIFTMNTPHYDVYNDAINCFSLCSSSARKYYIYTRFTSASTASIFNSYASPFNWYPKMQLLALSSPSPTASPQGSLLTQHTENNKC